jgi:hypothetical protein
MNLERAKGVAMADHILAFRILKHCLTKLFLLGSDLTLRLVQSSRWDGDIFLMIPGTSCLATIVLSLRDLEFGHSLVRVPSARRGEQKTAQGFSPGNDTHKEIALKGRPNGIDYNVYICNG